MLMHLGEVECWLGMAIPGTTNTLKTGYPGSPVQRVFPVPVYANNNYLWHGNSDFKNSSIFQISENICWVIQVHFNVFRMAYF